jgi:pyruvate dehydrogenase (quinone)
MVLDDAFRTALATSSPTCVIVTHDVQRAELPPKEQAHGVVATSPVLPRPRVHPAEADLRRAAGVLNAGERVALLVGRGAAGAADRVTAVAERLGAGVTTSLLGKPVLDERLPYHCGVMGHLGTTASAELMARCDTLLVVGSNDPWTEFYPAPGQARTVQLDVAARNIGAKTPVEVGLCGDAGETLAALLPLLEPAASTAWRAEVAAAVRRWAEVRAERAAAPARPLNPQRVLQELSAVLPHDAAVSVDVGSVTYWYARFLTLPPGVPAHLSSRLASMGSALPYGIAAKLARPGRPVVALAGDGAMQMNGLSELITVAHRWREWPDPRFVVLVLHNGDLAEVSWEQREMEGDPRFPASQEVPAFPYAGYAELLGLRGIRVDAPDGLAGAWAAALAADRPCVLEAVVDPDVPLLPPGRQEGAAEKMLDALAREPGGDRAAAQVRAHLAQEPEPGG